MRRSATSTKVGRLVAAIERDFAEREIRELDVTPVVALHPAIAADDRRQRRALEAALADAEASLQAVPALWDLIERSVLTPNSKDGASGFGLVGWQASLPLPPGRKLPARVIVKAGAGEGNLLHFSISLKPAENRGLVIIRNRLCYSLVRNSMRRVRRGFALRYDARAIVSCTAPPYFTSRSRRLQSVMIAAPRS